MGCTPSCYLGQIQQTTSERTKEDTSERTSQETREMTAPRVANQATSKPINASRCNIFDQEVRLKDAINTKDRISHQLNALGEDLKETEAKAKKGAQELHEYNELNRKNDCQSDGGIPCLCEGEIDLLLNICGNKDQLSLNTIREVARQIAQVLENEDDILDFPERVIFLSSLVRFVATQENKRHDPDYKAAFLVCEKARTSKKVKDIVHDIYQVKETFGKL